MFLSRRIFKVIGLVLLFVATGCATVPKEVVELSYIIGQDMEAVHSSYKTLIHRHFENLRSQANAFLETRLQPAYLKEFITEGGLVQSAQGSDPNQVLEDVYDWVEVAMTDIGEKRRELIDPINRDEEALMKSVDEAFARLIRANAAITAHLNSLRKVQDVQDDALKALNLKDLRDNINNDLVTASEKAKKGIEKLEKTEGLIDRAAEVKERFLKSPEGGKKQ